MAHEVDDPAREFDARSGAVADLDEELHAKVLEYVTEARACVTCCAWKDYLYNALQLDRRIRFKRRLHDQGRVLLCYNAVRPLGDDFEESVGYNFTFLPGGAYKMQWARTFDAWSSQSEQHVGRWHISAGHVFCETLAAEDATEREVRYAPAGFRFELPIDLILKADDQGHFQAPDGSPMEPWELPARIGKAEDKTRTIRTEGMWLPQEAAQAPSTPTWAPMRADARFVDIDGVVHEVSGDIVANWPEHEWARLMRCRLRWGIVG